MAVTPGTRLGPYEIAAQIGAGGMGEVHRAMDVNLGRAVAIRALFGAVLIEMLTGARAFPGDDVALTMAAVMTATPDFGRLPPGLPSSLEPYLQRCLEKDPRRRVQAIGDVRLALDGAFEGVGIRRPAEATSSWRAGRAHPDRNDFAIACRIG